MIKPNYLITLLLMVSYCLGCSKSNYIESNKDETVDTLFFQNIQVTNLDKNISSTKFLSQLNATYEIDFNSDSTTLFVSLDDFVLVKSVGNNWSKLSFIYKKPFNKKTTIELTKTINDLLNEEYTSKETLGEGEKYFFRTWHLTNKLKVIFIQDRGYHNELTSAIFFHQKY